MGKPKIPAMPAPPPPAPSAPDYGSSFIGRSQRNAMASAMGGTFLTQGQQPLVRRNQRKTVLG